MKDPLSSTVCSHSYEREAIVAYLQQHRDHVTCPVNGCRATLRRSNLQENPSLKREAQAYARRQERKRLQAQAGTSSIVD
ncbi:hypothetical protein IE81DRAFT_319682 [Ceraceosorus guamensis]|nr:hypothetical protein IE81DRAFT_319682 [Ceraceosorus guamensis]PWN45844.1 hypothetical protein IE81DRAFT_319682 [Ceraceosorus guamensis]